MKKDPLKPSAALLVKIGSAMIHAEELIETKMLNAEFDIPAFKTLSEDPEVKAWVKEMGPLLPHKRSAK